MEKFTGDVLKGKTFQHNFGTVKRSKECDVTIDYICGPYGRKYNNYEVHISLSAEDSQKVNFSQKGQIMMTSEEILCLNFKN